MENYAKFILPAGVFLLTVASGFWLGHAGKPLNQAIFSIHKLIAMGAVIDTGVQIARIFQATEIQTSLLFLLIISALCVLVLFATGALMSIGKASYSLMQAIHAITPIPLVIAITALVLVFTRG
jgi:hypothetical protein